MIEFTRDELFDIAKSLKVVKYSSLTKPNLIKAISEKLSKSATVKDSTKKDHTHISRHKYTTHSQIGNTGKDAKTYLVTDKLGDNYAMKVFKKTKSGKKIADEVALQKICAKSGISPSVVDYDTENKFIVMDKMDTHLFDVIKKQAGILTETQQKQVIRLFKVLDKIHVFHGDANILNYMYKGPKLYIIDFGYGAHIDSAQIKKLGTKTPNMEIMLLGFILKLKDLGCPPQAYTYLSSYLTPEKKASYNL